MTKINSYIDSFIHNLDKKVIVVTGANSGVGFALCRIVLQKHGYLVMACRNLQKAESAKKRLLKEFPEAFIEIIQYFQDDFNSCKTFAEEIIKKYPTFYSLVLNAAIMCPNKKDKNSSGLPLTSATNFFGPLVILETLKSYLDDSEIERRIVIQGSLASFMDKYSNFEKSYLQGNLPLMKQYHLSKLAITNAYFYYAERNVNPNIKFMLGEPGVCFTSITRNYPFIIRELGKCFLKLVCHNTTCAALSVAYLSCSPHANGDYYKPGGLFAIKGLPKRATLKNKYIIPEIMQKGLKIIKR